MNWERIEADWQQFKGSVREKWAKLTDQDLERIAGQKDRLFGLLKERYGLEKEHASKEIDGWLAKLEQQNDKRKS